MRVSSISASGVPPSREMRSTCSSRSGGRWPLTPEASTIASAAPLKYAWPSWRTPLMRVSALKGNSSGVGRQSVGGRCAHLLGERLDAAAFGRVVAEARLARADDARPAGSAPPTGRISAARRLPKVIVPVLSSSSTSTSPAASTARPDMASTLKRVTRSMPAMPIADSSPPMVVGIRHTSSAIRMTVETGVPA